MFFGTRSPHNKKIEGARRGLGGVYRDFLERKSGKEKGFKNIVYSKGGGVANLLYKIHRETQALPFVFQIYIQDDEEGKKPAWWFHQKSINFLLLQRRLKLQVKKSSFL